MSWPIDPNWTTLLKTFLDNGADDPSQARAQIEAAVDRLNAVCVALETIIENGQPYTQGDTAFYATGSGSGATKTAGLDEWGASVYATPLYNVGSAFSASTGRFTAPVTGVYRFEAIIEVIWDNTVTSGNRSCNTQFRINGAFTSVFGNGGYQTLWRPGSSATETEFVHLRSEITLNAGEYVSVFYGGGTGSASGTMRSFRGRRLF